MESHEVHADVHSDPIPDSPIIQCDSNTIQVCSEENDADNTFHHLKELSGCHTASSTPLKADGQNKAAKKWLDDNLKDIIPPNETELTGSTDLKSTASMQSNVYEDIRATVNKRVELLFKDFDDKVEVLVQAKVNEMCQTMTTINNSTLDKSTKTPGHDHLKEVKRSLNDIEYQYQELWKRSDKASAERDSLEIVVQRLQCEIKTLQTELRSFRTNADENYATYITSNESSNKRMATIEETVGDHLQYSRRETIEFCGIHSESTRYSKENCYDIIINFLRIHFDIYITSRDISICHRQDNPSERKKMGNKYIPPIYCKMVNRSLGIYILDIQERCLRNVKNRFGQTLSVVQNLTYDNRILWESVKTNLSSYRVKYVVNGSGKIIVRKNNYSKPIHVPNNKKLAELIAETGEPDDPKPNNKADEDKNESLSLRVEEVPPETAPLATQRAESALQVISDIQHNLPAKNTVITPKGPLPPNGRVSQDQRRSGKPLLSNSNQAASNYLLPHATDRNAERYSNNYPSYHLRMPFAPYQHIPRMRAETYAKAVNTPPRLRAPMSRNSSSRYRFPSPRTQSSRIFNPRPLNPQSQNARFVNSNFVSGNIDSNAMNPFFHENPFSALSSDCWY